MGQSVQASARMQGLRGFLLLLRHQKAKGRETLKDGTEQAEKVTDFGALQAEVTLQQPCGVGQAHPLYREGWGSSSASLLKIL